MKLLIITQKVDKNDGILGFFHQWIIEFAKKCEKTTVICLEKGENDLPENVQVFSLGKEGGESKLKYLKNFYKYIWKLRNDYDTVFVHMNPEYVVLGGLFWEIWRKKIFLWYTHKSVNLWLRLANNFADKIFTASEKSFRLESDKVVVMGHGISTEEFRIKNLELRKENKKYTILTAGRISEAKNIHLLVEVGEILKKKNFDFKIKIAGEPVLDEDKIYFEKLKQTVKEKNLVDLVSFEGVILHNDMPEFLGQGDLFINLSSTGSLDKAVLEAMASGLLVLTSNEAFKEILPSKYFVNNDSVEIAEKVIVLSEEKPDPELREYVVKNHNLENLIDKLLSV